MRSKDQFDRLHVECAQIAAISLQLFQRRGLYGRLDLRFGGHRQAYATSEVKLPTPCPPIRLTATVPPLKGHSQEVQPAAIVVLDQTIYNATGDLSSDERTMDFLLNCERKNPALLVEKGGANQESAPSYSALNSAYHCIRATQLHGLAMYETPETSASGLDRNWSCVTVRKPFAP